MSNNYEYAVQELAELGTKQNNFKKRAKFYRNKARSGKVKLFWITILSIISCFIYLISPYSKVQNIVFTNSYQVNSEIIKQRLNINYSQFVFLFDTLQNNGIDSIYNVEQVRVEKKLNGKIIINVIEKDLIGYFKDQDKTLMIFGSGAIEEITDDKTVYYDLIPEITFKQDPETQKAIISTREYANFIKEYRAVFENDDDFSPTTQKYIVGNGISKIEYAPEKYDTSIFRLYLDNETKDTFLVNSENINSLRYLSELVNEKNSRFQNVGGEFDATVDQNKVRFTPRN